MYPVCTFVRLTSSSAIRRPQVGAALTSWFSRWRMACVAVLLICGLTPVSGNAQTEGTLRGTVQDAQKAVVPGATISLLVSGNLTPRTAVTDAPGAYAFDDVNAGTLALQVDAPGFRRASRNVRLHLAAGAALVEDVVLDIAGISDSVVVTATRSDTEMASAPISANVITRVRTLMTPPSALPSPPCRARVQDDSRRSHPQRVKSTPQRTTREPGSRAPHRPLTRAAPTGLQ